ncbi:MAG: hypothetical protein ACPHEP_01465 [Acidimicrobiales bacterium]|jgi:hypothetical protein
MTSELPKETKALMPITDLRIQLRKQGIVDVPRSTVRNWYLFGVSTPKGRIKLKTKKIGKRRMSSIRWTIDFLKQQDSSED